jgi:hypothetical protein
MLWHILMLIHVSTIEIHVYMQWDVLLICYLLPINKQMSHILDLDLTQLQPSKLMLMVCLHCKVRIRKGLLSYLKIFNFGLFLENTK